MQHDGLWWDPSEPSQKWVGTLRFDQRDGVSLTITVPTEKPTLFPSLRTYDLILGVASSGKLFTLIDCFDRSTRGSLFGVPRTVRIHANALIVGFHCDTTDPLLSTVSVSFLHANEWWARSGVESDPAVKHPDFAARYRSSEPVLLYEEETFRVMIRSSVAGSIGNYQASMRERISFEVHASTPRPLSGFQRLTRACSDFLSIACLTYCDTEDFSLVHGADEGASRRIGTFHAVPFYKNRKGRSSAVVHMLFRFTDIEARAATIFREWLSKLDQLEDARALYFSGIYGRGFIEHRLLALTQAAEALHRRFFPDRYMDDADFETQVFQPLKAAIPASADASLRAAITACLKYANEHSLRRRLQALFEAHGDVLRLLVPEPDEYISPIIETRNEFTHFPVPASEAPQPATRPDPERVLLHNWILRLLLETCFLRAMGFSTDEIASFVRRSETSRQMSVRFRNREAASGDQP